MPKLVKLSPERAEQLIRSLDLKERQTPEIKLFPLTFSIKGRTGPAVCVDTIWDDEFGQGVIYKDLDNNYYTDTLHYK